MNIKDFWLGAFLKKGGVKFDKFLRGCKGKLLDIDMYNTAVYNFAKEMAENLGIEIKPFAVQKYKGDEFVCERFLKDGKLY